MKKALTKSVAILILNIFTNVFADNSLNKIQNDVLILKSTINQTNKNIHIKNQEYKSVLKELKIFEDKTRVVQFTLSEYKQKIRKDYLILQKNWNVLVMQQADENRHTEYLMTHKKIIENMKFKTENLKRNIAWATNLENELTQATSQAQELKIKSEVLLGLIQKLENEKMEIANKVYEKNNQSRKVESSVITKTLETKLAGGEFYLEKNFILPIAKYKRVEKSESGINFYYNDVTSLIAPSDGKIIYLGELSNYGNVIMIEHDKNMISVLLGDIRSDLEEMSLVTQGSVIGKLSADREGGYKTLYYEIRKEEKPVPTLSLLKIN
jgi:septal ring factor EnvC (AmiA/AmiB activator)